MSPEATLTPESVLARLERVPFLGSHLRIAAILGTGTFFDAFDSLMIGIVLALIVASFKISFVAAALLISGGSLGQFVGALAIGVAAERFGRKPAFVAALALFGVCSLFAAFAVSFQSLVVCRILQGLGLGAEVPIAGALFNEFVRSKTRGRVIMAYESLFTWGILATPLIAGPLVTSFGPERGWRTLFLLGSIPIAVALVAWRALPESPRWLVSRGRTAEADAIVSAMELEADKSGHTLARPEPMPPLVTKRTSLVEVFSPMYGKRTILSWTQWFTTYFTQYGYSVWLPLLYVRIGGLTATHAIALTILPGALSLAMAYLLSATMDRVGRKTWFVIGYSVACAAMLMGLALDARGIHGWPVLFAVGVLVQTFSGINALGVYLYTPELFPTRMRAWATSTGSAAARIASVVAPAIVGALLARGMGVISVFALFACVSLIGLVVMLVLGIETKRTVLEQLSP